MRTHALTWQSYASTDAGRDHDQAAVEGTSMLVLPTWLRWFTANLGYHHVHHLRRGFHFTGACHTEHEHLFVGVRRITLRETRLH